MIFVGLLISLSIVSEFIFLSPIFVFHVPTSAILDFTLIVIIAALSGIVTSLSTYRIRMLGNTIKKSGTGFFGSLIGASAGACGCGSFGFVAVSAFGTVGGTATSFLTNYETPLRMISIAILCYACYVSVKSITSQCKILK
ncbi:MAG: hypothetical protein KGI28_03400 [Thaumarchaeota archaeon]|nr:hypothetical protein [Nitrososphaerota archaeon]